MTHTCDNCGAPIERRLGASRVLACPFCATTQVVVDDVLRSAGSAGAMLDAPTLLELDRPAVVAGRRVRPVGHLRYSYGPGWWDEFWCEAGRDTVWVSVDEGDVAIEHPLSDRVRRAGMRLALGETLELPGVGVTGAPARFTVVEAETAECVAFRGELPEVVRLGERHLFFDALGERGAILSAEQWEEDGERREAWFVGQWVDPWTVTHPEDGARGTVTRPAGGAR
ncbi:MAG: DUF4178 domain-containing protein [Paracoccaceae bacterium]